MNNSQVEAFLTVTRLGSLSKAASVLFVSQSTISQRIKAMEMEYDVILLRRDRGVKGISLTNEGEKFYKIALKYEEIYAEARGINNTTRGMTVVIAAVDSVHNYVMIDKYKKLNEKLPEIRLGIHTHQSKEIYMLLEQREIDIGLTLQDRVMQGIAVEELFSESMVLIKREKKGEKKSITKNEELDVSKQILVNWGAEYRIWHEKHWGPLANSFIQVDTPKMMIEYIRDSAYWAIVPISLASYMKRKNIAEIFTLEDPPPARTCYIVNRENSDEDIMVVRDEILKMKPSLNFNDASLL